MLRRYVCAAVAVLAVSGFVLAETVTGVITKMDGNKVTVRVFDKEKKGKGEEKEYTLTDKTEFGRRKGKDKDADPEKASKDDLVKAVGKAKEGAKEGGKGKGMFGGVFATLDVEDGKVKKVIFREGFGGGKKKKKDE